MSSWPWQEPVLSEGGRRNLFVVGVAERCCQREKTAVEEPLQAMAQKRTNAGSRKAGSTSLALTGCSSQEASLAILRWLL
jgi:hypothetical protein